MAWVEGVRWLLWGLAGAALLGAVVDRFLVVTARDVEEAPLLGVIAWAFLAFVALVFLSLLAPGQPSC